MLLRLHCRFTDDFAWRFVFVPPADVPSRDITLVAMSSEIIQQLLSSAALGVQYLRGDDALVAAQADGVVRLGKTRQVRRHASQHAVTCFMNPRHMHIICCVMHSLQRTLRRA